MRTSVAPHRRHALTLSACAALLAVLAPVAPASAAEPTVQLVSPADGAVSTTADPALSVVASDPDGDPLDVTFEGRRKGETTGGGSAGEPFTVVALPDLQNYTNRTRGPMIAQQTRWIADQRTALNTQFVVQLGDLVSAWDYAGHWPWTSDGLKVLEDRKVPYAVVPGNHDFDYRTGGFTEYDRWFPTTRFSTLTPTPSTARYGGFMGQDQFGDDPVDRRNMNNYSLFSAGGVDWLVLGLEWEAPPPSLEWADRVLAAHPDRQVIMFTHSFLNLDGTRRTVPQRPGGTPQEGLWRDFVRTHCQVRLVLSGHENSGELGEARRTDANACGRPVHQVLSNYQARANGGNGWLRTYRFDPAAGTVTAATYSPYLNQYETDADSAFTLPFAFPASDPQPVPFMPITTVRAASGETATASWAGLEPDTEYEWRVRVSDGTSTVTSPVRTVRTPPPAGPRVEDRFARSVTGGWGTADRGGTWAVQGRTSLYAVAGGTGQHVLTQAGTEAFSTLSGSPARDVELRTDLAWSRPSSQGVLWTRLVPRAVTARDDYRLTLNIGTAGRPRLDLARRVNGTETVLRSVQVSGLTIAANTRYTTVVRTVTAGGTTTLSAKIFPAGTPEPAWQATVTDATASLQGPGGITLSTYMSSGATAPVTTHFDDLTLRESP